MSKPLGCERARVWAALAPDGALSSFERRLLATHVARCGSCARFAAGADAIATVLREAPPEPVPHPIAVPSRGRRVRAFALAPVAAVAAVVLLTLSVSSVGVDPRTGTSRAVLVVVARPADNRAEVRELRAARREQLVATHAHVNVERFRPGVHI